MHIIIITKFKLFIKIFLIYIYFSVGIIFAEDCQDFNTKINEAKEYFPLHNEIELNYSLRSAFIINYNRFSKGEKKLEADKIILLTLLDRNEWYVFASKKDCLIFWINLEPDRFIELIDGGSIAKDQGIWRRD